MLGAVNQVTEAVGVGGNIVQLLRHTVLVQGQALGRLRRQLERWMLKTNDPLLETFRRRDDAEFRESVVQTQEREAMASKAKRRKKK